MNDVINTYDPVTNLIWRTYRVLYTFEGEVWGFTIHATSHDQAEAMLKSLKVNALVQGEIIASEGPP